MKVAMLLENNPYPQDVRVRNEAESLAAAGHEVTVIAPRSAGQKAVEGIGGVTVRRYRLPVASGGIAAFLLEYAVAHAQLFWRGLGELLRGAEVLHLHNPPDTLFPIGLVARATGRKVVFDHHDLFPDLFAEKFGSSRLVALAEASQRASLGTATAVLFTNRSQAENALARGLRPERLSIVRNGPRRATLREASRARQGELETPRLVFVGELASHDGVLALPELMAKPGLERATLTLVGDGPERSELAAAFSERGMSDRVEFTGHVEHRLVPALIAAADICIDPAPCSELNHRSTMIKVTEYLAAGRPVVAFGLTETRRTAEDAALYAPCGDLEAFAELIVQLAREPALREELSERAIERADGLVWERSEVELLGAYERL
jgi:glycosyltransferase involved in cell wall biosynthesis